MKVMKIVSIIFFAIELCIISVFLSLNGVHTNEELLKGGQLDVSSAYLSPKDKSETVFNKTQTLTYTGRFYYHFIDDEYIFEVVDNDNNIYWIIPHETWADDYLAFNDAGKRGGLYGMYIHKYEIITSKTNFFIILNLVLVWVFALPVFIIITKLKSKKIIISILIPLSIIISCCLAYAIYLELGFIIWILVLIIIIELLLSGSFIIIPLF